MKEVQKKFWLRIISIIIIIAFFATGVGVAVFSLFG